MSTIVLGAGGHAKVVIELLQASGKSVSYCIGDEHSHDVCANVKVLKGDEHLRTLRQQGYKKIFIAIGDNKKRRELAHLVKALDYELVNAISPHAVISSSAKLGNGIAIMGGVVINAESKIGDVAIVNTGATIDHDCRIGEATHIAPQVAIAGNVSVGQGTFLGIGCKVIPGITIGEWTVVGAGGVIIKDLPDHVMAKGVPAKVYAKIN